MYPSIVIEDIQDTLPRHSWERIKVISTPAYNLAEEKGLIHGEGRVWKRRSVDSIQRVIVHQTAAEGTPESFARYHTEPNHVTPFGMPALAYHFYIPRVPEKSPDGVLKVFQTNDLESITWHTKGSNTIALGVVLEGALFGAGWRGGKRNPTNDQMDALRGLWAHLKVKLDIDGKGLFGHYHFGKPACPGTYVKKWIEVARKDHLPYFATVDEMQSGLVDIGYEGLAIDGLYGPETRKALASFQHRYRKWGLNVDGYWDDATAQILEKVVSVHAEGLTLSEDPEVY